MTVTPQELYPNIPPTKIRNRKEVFRHPKNIPFWEMIADLFFYNMLENRFFSLMIKGKENLQQLNENYATIFYAPHSNWWDGILGYNIIRRVVKNRKLRMMIEEMNRFPLFQYAGAYPVNKKSAQTAMIALKYSVEKILGDKEIAMWLFPQGIIRPPHYRPEIFQPGLAFMVQESVKRYGGINLVPVATNFCFLREDKPEILVEFDVPKFIDKFDYKRKEFTEFLQKDFENFCDRQQANVACANFEGYEYVFKKKLSWWKIIEKKLRSIGMKGIET